MADLRLMIGSYVFQINPSQESRSIRPVENGFISASGVITSRPPFYEDTLKLTISLYEKPSYLSDVQELLGITSYTMTGIDYDSVLDRWYVSDITGMIYELNPNFTIFRSYDINPIGQTPTSPIYGVAKQGSFVWAFVSDGINGYLYKVDPVTTNEVVHYTYGNSTTHCRSLIYNSVDGYLYLLNAHGKIYRVDVSDGSIVDFATLEGYGDGIYRYYGLGFDGVYFWLWDNVDRVMVQLDLYSSSPNIVTKTAVKDLNTRLSNVTSSNYPVGFFSNGVKLIFQNSIHSLVVNTVNAELIALKNEIKKKTDLYLFDSFGQMRRVIVTRMGIERKENMGDFRYDLSLDIKFAD